MPMLAETLMSPEFLIPRRRLISSSALAAAGLTLPGCTQVAARSASSVAAPPSLCLPPVKVSRDRVIRETVGLRPYRDSGFVVRMEPLGAKRLVHNYGHGGAGITLSWGTSKLATQLGLQGHQGPVAVLGAGVIGLTTARLVQEAGFPVTIYAEAMPPETTSNIAGGQWLPSSYFSGPGTPEWRTQNEAAIDYSYRRFQIMAGDDYGIRWITNYFQMSSPPANLPPGGTISQPTKGSPLQPDWAVLERHQHPFGFDRARKYQLMMVETTRFLQQLMRDVQVAGGGIAIKHFASPAEVAALPETLVFNCTGLGARALFGDKELIPIRGQLAVLLPQPEVDYALGAAGGAYMFPRRDGIVLGGTYERDNWSTVPDPATTDRLVALHQRVFGEFRCQPGTRKA